MLSPLFDTDSYKSSHFKLFPPGTNKVYSYFESRLGDGFEKIMFFGLQYIIKNIIAKQITIEEVKQAEKFFNEHIGTFNTADWEYIVNTHNGYLPLQIKAVPEGTVLSRGNVLVTIENTDPKLFWLPQYIETIIVRNWSTINVATISYHMKLILLEAFNKTSDSANPNIDVLFKLHDFGSRGAYCQEAASIGGMGHLINFMGSDTISAILMAQTTYDTSEMLAYSIPALEHSCVTSWGQNGEKSAFENMIKTYGGKTPFLAMVADSYDLEYAVKQIIGVELKDLIINCGSTVVVRPDSGVPKESVLKCLKWLSDAFGYTVNSKGYKVLPSCVRVIQGDGITMESLPDLVQFITGAGYSIDNVAFGMGGGLLAKHDRDTFRFAQKCSYIEIDGVGSEVRKIPKTDMTKASKGGKLKLVLEDGEYITVKDDGKDGRVDQLQVVYYFNAKYGHTEPLFNKTTFQEIRQRTGTW